MYLGGAPDLQRRSPGLAGGSKKPKPYNPYEPYMDVFYRASPAVRKPRPDGWHKNRPKHPKPYEPKCCCRASPAVRKACSDGWHKNRPKPYINPI